MDWNIVKMSYIVVSEYVCECIIIHKSIDKNYCCQLNWSNLPPVDSSGTHKLCI